MGAPSTPGPSGFFHPTYPIHIPQPHVHPLDPPLQSRLPNCCLFVASRSVISTLFTQQKTPLSKVSIIHIFSFRGCKSVFNKFCSVRCYHLVLTDGQTDNTYIHYTYNHTVYRRHCDAKIMLTHCNTVWQIHKINTIILHCYRITVLSWSANVADE